MPDTHVTITGNLTADPELKFTPNGAAVANFRVAVTARVRDGNAWRDGDTPSTGSPAGGTSPSTSPTRSVRATASWSSGSCGCGAGRPTRASSAPWSR
jgi:hypothetical protein